VLAAAAVRAELEAEEAALVDRSSTTAPAPSPKSTSVERSVQSRIFESTSPPTTSARFERPGRDHAVRLRERVHEAGAAGEQVVGGRVGHAERVGEQRRARREHHVRRHRRDDDQVDRAASTPASRERGDGRGGGDVGQRLSSVAKRPSRIPVRSTIHSSDVSTNCSRSLFVKTRSGT
jgi:hypothetical protein